MTTPAIPPALKFWRLLSAWVLVLVAVLQIGTVLYGLIMKVNEIYVLVTPFFLWLWCCGCNYAFFRPGSVAARCYLWWHGGSGHRP